MPAYNKAFRAKAKNAPSLNFCLTLSSCFEFEVFARMASAPSA